MIDYFCDKNSRANSPKVAIMLEECGAEYRRCALDIYDKDAIDPSFYRVSPAGTVPAILDRDQHPPLPIFESGSILVYLAEKFGQFLPSAPPERARVLQWLFWQNSQLGPALYALSSFVRTEEEGSKGAVAYFTASSLRWLRLLEEQLAASRYIAAEYSIADIAIFPFALAAFGELDTKHLSSTRRWLSEVGERPAVQKAMPKPLGQAPRESEE